jgi:pimeloyl-ACP methyl ester carboxylesterase
LLVIAGLLGLAVMFENHFIYYPSKYPEGRWSLAGSGPENYKTFIHIEDKFLTTSDGIRIHGWLCSPGGGELSQATTLSSPSRDEPSRSQDLPVILFLHGNAGNITDRYELVQALVKIPVRVFIIDYRGYGKSKGTPSETGIYNDGQAAWDFLTGEGGINPGRIILYGESLGGAVAVELASRVNPGGLIVQSSFTSMREMISHIAPGVPRFLFHTRMDSLARVKNTSCPKLFVHGTNDELVPIEMGKRLNAASPAPKEFYEISGAGHNDVFETGGQAYIDKLRVFVNRSCHP